jgi:hypothetical protein
MGFMKKLGGKRELVLVLAEEGGNKPMSVFHPGLSER